jgi:hypothetical protein
MAPVVTPGRRVHLTPARRPTGGGKTHIGTPAREGTQWLARLRRRGIASEGPRPGDGSRALAVFRARFGVAIACLGVAVMVLRLLTSNLTLARALVPKTS